MLKEKKTVKETRKIDVIGDKIRYTLGIDGGVDILDYTETIYNILFFQIYTHPTNLQVFLLLS